MPHDVLKPHNVLMPLALLMPHDVQMHHPVLTSDERLVPRLLDAWCWYGRREPACPYCPPGNVVGLNPACGGVSSYHTACCELVLVTQHHC